MDMKPVTSSNIKAIGYDPATKTLAVQFAHGGLYHYSGVEQSVHDDLLKAKSIGGHFYKHVRNSFTSAKQQT
jgi:hypothetical protein